MQTIAVLGMGRIGLPTAATFANAGLDVICVDIDAKKVSAIQDGYSGVKEKGLGDMLRAAISAGRLRIDTEEANAVQESDAVIICVPTPLRNGKLDSRYLSSALDMTAEGMHRGLLIIIQSTLPPRTTEDFVKPRFERNHFVVDEDFFLAYVPERLALGNALKEYACNPRIIGGVSPKSTRMAAELYRRISREIFETDSTTAELIKLAENTFRDLNIAYANLLALISEKLHVDVAEVVRLANTHPRVNIHKPGPGVGGPCLTKDPYLLLESVKDRLNVDLIDDARKMNEYMPHHVVRIVRKALRQADKRPDISQIVVLGTAYKGDVDDVRESPAKIIITELLELGCKVTAYDPYTSESFGAKYADNLYRATKDADLILIVTDHSEFKSVNLRKIGKLMRPHPILVDSRRIVSADEAVEAGLEYYGIGVGESVSGSHYRKGR